MHTWDGIVSQNITSFRATEVVGYKINITQLWFNYYLSFMRIFVQFMLFYTTSLGDFVDGESWKVDILLTFHKIKLTILIREVITCRDTIILL